MNPYDDAAYAKGYDESLELRRERDSFRDALYTARRELDVVRDEVGNLLERLRIKGDQLDAAEDDIDRLNQMLRATGYGQGQIDAYADECEARERAQRELDEALLRINQLETECGHLQADKAELRGLLREAKAGNGHTADWWNRVTAALEGKS